MSDVDALITGARLAEDTFTLCTRADLLAEHGRVDAELRTELAKQAADPRLAGRGTDLAERLQDLQREIEASTVEFRLRALPRRQWQQLLADHPPRQAGDGSVVDEDENGVNNETFFPALIRLSTVEPKLQDDTWAALLDPDGEHLTDAQYQAWTNKCSALNRRDVSVPFSLAASLTMRHSATESSSPAASA